MTPFGNTEIKMGRNFFKVYKRALLRSLYLTELGALKILTLMCNTELLIFNDDVAFRGPLKCFMHSISFRGFDFSVFPLPQQTDKSQSTLTHNPALIFHGHISCPSSKELKTEYGAHLFFFIFTTILCGRLNRDGG